MPIIDKETASFRFAAEEKALIKKRIDEDARSANTRDGKLDQAKYLAAMPTESEFEWWIYFCETRRLNPLTNDAYFQKRSGKVTPLTSIDTYRRKAEETGCYAPGKAPVFFGSDGQPSVKGTPLLCEVFAKKRTPDGIWHEFSEIAYFDEYKQTKYDGGLNSMWTKMPHSQLSKCAESRLLRKGWPEQLSGIFTFDEMAQADSDPKPHSTTAPSPSTQPTAAPAPQTAVTATAAPATAQRPDMKQSAAIAAIHGATNLDDLKTIFNAAFKAADTDADAAILKEHAAARKSELTPSPANQQPAQPAQPATDGLPPISKDFHYETGELMDCQLLGTIKLAAGALSVKTNSTLQTTCFLKHLHEALIDGAKGRYRAMLEIAEKKDKTGRVFLNIADIRSIDGIPFKDGKPQFVATNEDVPQFDAPEGGTPEADPIWDDPNETALMP
jgi:phage recombination protein Bet